MSLARARLTKVICSYQASSLNDELAKQVNEQPIDALRLIYDVGAASHSNILEFIRKVAAAGNKESTSPSIMIDIASKVRAVVAGLNDPKELVYGEKVRLTPEDGSGDIKVSAEDWSSLFAEDAAVFFGYGNAELKVLSVSEKEITAEIVQGGTIYPKMDIHVPSTRKESSINIVDKKSMLALLKAGIDYLVVPGFVSPKELNDFRQMCVDEKVEAPWIIVKVNSEKIYSKLSELLPDVHGVLISRLEMALFFDPAMVPILTKEIIQLCNDKAKVAITASEMLGSMRHNPTPTRAEVSDIANAVVDGTDAVVLSEEVVLGNHMERAVQLMSKIIEDVEGGDRIAYNWQKHNPTVQNEMDAVAYAAFTTAKRLPLKAIVCLTKEGNTAVKLSSYQISTPIIAVTFSQAVLRKMSLVRGVEGILLEADPVIDQVLGVVNDLLVRKSGLQVGDKIILVTITISPLGKQASNLFTLQTIS